MRRLKRVLSRHFDLIVKANDMQRHISQLNQVIVMFVLKLLVNNMYPSLKVL
ncbi:hypothetical protein E1A91_D12G100400v1 [Gossypium mustelinum]|uniref:Uncharacterized protein n=1 Tax=Gossypium mustelinum TaxID=34275 RepID=A0A5D2SCQ7_GOSMU|nr:hypothetical protein E1A91_D12G100400v1 [Gossypium mustelinum]